MVERTMRIVGTFSDEYGAISALEVLKYEPTDREFAIDEAAVLRRTADGTLKISGNQDLRRKVGDAHAGGISGEAVGLVSGITGWLTGIGALAGSLAAKCRNPKSSDEHIHMLGDSLAPGTSAIVLVAHGERFDLMEKDLKSVGARVVTETVLTDLGDQRRIGVDNVGSRVAFATSNELRSTGSRNGEWC